MADDEIWKGIKGETDNLLYRARQAADDICIKTSRRLDVLRDVRETKARMAEVEHDAILHCEFNGKNAEIRAAQLAEHLARNADYAQMQLDLPRLEHQAATLENDIDYQRNILSITKLAIRWNIAIAEAWGRE